MSSTGTTANVGNATGGTSATPTVGLSMQPYQQTAPMTTQQLAGMGQVSNLAQPVQNALTGALNINQALGSGALMNPGMMNFMQSGALMNPQNNPNLQQYAQDALQQQLQNYQQVTAPNLLQQGATTGTLGSQGLAQGFQNAQTALSQGIGNTLAGIYEPAYQYGVGATQNALNTGLGATQGAVAQTPTLASAQYTPAQQLYQYGSYGQQQAQDVLNKTYSNLSNQANWPFTALSALGQGLSTASGGGNQQVQIGTAPSTAAGK